MTDSLDASSGRPDSSQDVDVSASALDVEGNDEVSETGNPDAYADDPALGGTLGGLGGAESTPGGAG